LTYQDTKRPSSQTLSIQYFQKLASSATLLLLSYFLLACFRPEQLESALRLDSAKDNLEEILVTMASAPKDIFSHDAEKDDTSGTVPETQIHSDWTEEEEKKLVRKVDMWLMPTIWLMYLLSYMDRTK
jgi:hypothetical protein